MTSTIADLLGWANSGSGNSLLDDATAEQRVTRSPLDVAAMQRMHLGGDEGSDGENAAEDLEVRSLSLSEDGPVIARALSERERKTAAPDPIAMLTHGQHHVGDLDRAEQRGEKQNAEKTPERSTFGRPLVKEGA